jgi:putative RNA 2'-phosphotransferase
MIRASQGHSLGIELNLTPTRPPAHLYHGTDSGSYEKIMKSGAIEKMSRDHLHLSKDEDTARKVGMRHLRSMYDLVVLRINSDAMHADGYKFFLSDNGVWLTERVPTFYIGDVNFIKTIC